MRNIIKVLMCAILAFAFVGCTESGEENNANRLATPNFTARAEGNQITVSWEEVAGAAYYEVALDPGSVEKTDKLIHRFDELQYNTEYKVSVRAIAPDAAQNSNAEVKSVKTEERIVPHYREFYPVYGAAPSAISNNGRWVVGGNERCGYVLDLSTDKMVEFSDAEFYDVADDGTAVGSDHSENMDGNAAILIGDKMVAIDLSELASNYGMSCATGITPDGEYVVGWYWEYDESCYYAQQYGMVIPFCYDVIKNKVTVPEVGDRLYNEVAAASIKAVAPDRTLLGYEQSQGIHSIIWADEYTPFEYVYFEYDEQYNPVFSLGDTQNLFSQTGRYIYGKAVDYAAGQNTYAAAYDRETETLMTFPGGSVTAMTDDGVAFLNDVPYYLGTTSYVVDVTKGEPYEWTELEEWLFDEHDVDIASFLPTTDTDSEDGLLLEGVITVAVSEDGRVIVGMTNTNQGWLTFVVDLDGAAQYEL
ncbi:MAG: hypothetical protein IKY50_05555 [Alistipes sp.]|nr:hypothetical protein [Alistipes sp.]